MKNAEETDVNLSETNWLIDYYKKSKNLDFFKLIKLKYIFQESILTTNEIDLLTRKSRFNKQQTIQQTIDIDDKETNDNGYENYEKELQMAIIENDSNKIMFQNTKHNVGISNSYRSSSKMCILM